MAAETGGGGKLNLLPLSRCTQNSKTKKQTPASARFRATGAKAAAATSSATKQNRDESLPELEAYLRLVGGRDAPSSSASSSGGASAADRDRLRSSPASAEAWWRFLAAEERAAAAAAPGGNHVPPPPPLVQQPTATGTAATTATPAAAAASLERSSSLALLRLYEAATRRVPRGNTNLHALSRLWLGLARRAWTLRSVDDGRDALKALRSSSRLGARDAHLWAQWALLEAFCAGGGAPPRA